MTPLPPSPVPLQLARPLRIAFMTTVGRNVGDEFIRDGIRSLLDDVLGRGAYEPYYVDKHDPATLHRPLCDEVERLADKFRDADVIIQAGAPVYWNNGRHTSYNAEWAQSMWFDRIFALGRTKLILNLGAGAGQKSEDDLGTLMSDRALIDFAQRAGEACGWTAVRDPLAAAFLDRIGVACDLLPCPAFHAARRAGHVAPPRDLLAVNLMKLAGHFRLKPQTDAGAWRGVIDELLPRLRQRHRLVFVAHDRAEAEFQEALVTGGEHVFLAADYRDYVSVYGRVKGFVGNRVHGAVCTAGFGRPAVIVGNDCRIGIARPIGIPARDSAEVTADWIVESIDSQLDRAAALGRERLGLRETSAALYVARLRELLAQPFGPTPLHAAA